MDQAALQALADKQVGGNIHNIVIGVQSADGRIDLGAAAGIADPATGAPMTVETPYFLASIAKMYTAAAILKLHESGRLSLDAPLGDYLPAETIQGIHVMGGRDYTPQIKVYHLVSHTSGLPDYFDDKPKGGRSLFDDLKDGQDRAMDLDQVLAIARSIPPKFAPGASGKAHYADTNFQLLGAIIEAVTGQPIADAFQAMIFGPLGLAHTCAYDHTNPRPDAPAAMYLGDTVAHLPLFMSTTAPDGGLVATVGESLAFLRAFFAGELFDQALLARMTARWNRIFFPMQYGYALMRFTLPRLFSPFKPLPALIGHSGSSGSFAFHCPARALYIAGTVNQVGAPAKPFRLMMRIINSIQ